AARSSAQTVDRFGIAADEVVRVAKECLAGGRMERIEPHDPLQVLQPFFSPAPMNEREAEAVVDQVRVELEGACELRPAFGRTMQPAQDMAQGCACVWQMRVQFDRSLRQRYAAVKCRRLLILCRKHLVRFDPGGMAGPCEPVYRWCIVGIRGDRL